MADRFNKERSQIVSNSTNIRATFTRGFYNDIEAIITDCFEEVLWKIIKFHQKTIISP